MEIELDPVDRITVGAVGPPGERVFYLQARQGERVVTLLVEKQQVELLAASVVEILARVGEEVEEGPPEDELELEEPVLPEWRAGRISIGYEEPRDLVVLEAEEIVGSGEGSEAEREASVLRLWATREQMLALARHGVAVAARGRPGCPFCGNPMDPGGHICPAANGHRPVSEA